MKISLLLFILLFFSIFLSFSVEKNSIVNFNEVSYKNNLPSFNYSIQKKYSTDSNEKTARGFIGMGIAGASITGASFLFIIPGTVFVVYAVRGGVFKSSSEKSDMNIGEVYATVIVGTVATVILFYTGIALLIVGGIFLLVGLPLMIVGFAMAGHLNKKRVSFFIDGEKSIRTGISIRFN